MIAFNESVMIKGHQVYFYADGNASVADNWARVYACVDARELVYMQQEGLISECVERGYGGGVGYPFLGNPELTIIAVYGGIPQGFSEEDEELMFYDYSTHEYAELTNPKRRTDDGYIFWEKVYDLCHDYYTDIEGRYLSCEKGEAL